MKINKFSDNIFSKVHSSNLIYNTCWEDPRIDRKLLKIKEKDQIVMITSAGCNALDYSLDNPKEINCIDLNFRQNALLELKKVLINLGDYELFYEFFGNGYKEDARKIYSEKLRAYLPTYAQSFWDLKINYFQNRSKKRTFYFHGTSGNLAWFTNKFLISNNELRKSIDSLLECNSLEEQTIIYNNIEDKLLSGLIKWLVNKQIILNMLGVPRAQKNLILKKYPNGGVGEYLKESLRNIFTKLPIKENYFWYLYLKGSYQPNRCPEYLKNINFNHLKNYDGIKIYTSSINQFLKENPGKYSHYVLLDHQDWLAHNDLNTLNEEWELILKNSRKGTKILMRSAALEIDFIPHFAKKSVKLKNDVAYRHQLQDRVGTYGCTYLMEVN